MKLFTFPDDDLAMLRIFLKISCLWPENMTWWKKMVQLTHWPVTPCISLPWMIWFCCTEAIEKGLPELVQGISDCFAVVTFVVRGILIIRRSKVIYTLSKSIDTGFKHLEVNHEVKHVKHSKLVFSPSFAFFLVTIFSAAVCGRALMMPPDNRETSHLLPSYLVHKDGVFHFVVATWMFGHWHVMVLNTVTDSLIICTATAMQGKVETLKSLIEDLRTAKSTSQQNLLINNVIKYHTLIIKLHQTLEGICRGPLLVQFCFLVLSLGSPAFRLFYSTISFQMIVFMSSYLSWVASQLCVYCFVCDEATHAGMSIGAAVYKAYNVHMDPKVVRKIVVVMSVASRPLHFTAMGLIKVNRKAFLKLVRRSYSFYSAMLNFK